MLYVVKWLYLWILPLGGIVVIMAAAAAYQFRRRSAGRAAVMAALVLLYGLSVEPAEVLLMRPLETRYAQPAPDEVRGDVIIFLGGGAVASVPDTGGEGQLAGASANRLLTAARLQKRRHLPVILSGGVVTARDADESAAARRALTDLGVDEAMIVTEGKSRTTAENAAYAAAICRSRGWRRPIVVTSAFHMPRAAALFAREGLDVTPYPCDYRTGGAAASLPYAVIPRAAVLADSCLALKEYAALAALCLGLL